MRRNNGASSGFTFLEIVIAISILAVIMGVTYSALSSILRTKKLLDDGRDAKVIADSVLGRMTRELQLAYAGLPLMPPRDKIEQPYSPRINLVAEPETSDGGRPIDSVTFLALEGGQYLPDGGTHTGVVQITYRVEVDPERKGERDPSYYLIREEVPYSRPFDKAYKKAMIFPITKQLVSLDYRFLDGSTGEWSESWGAPPRVKLPSLIQFTLTLRSPEGQLKSFRSAVALRAEEG